MVVRRTSNNRIAGWQLSLLSVGTFTLGLDGFVLTGLLPQIASDLSVSVATAGQLTAIFSITYAIASPLIATVTGRWDRRTLLWGGMAVFLAGLAAQALGPSFGLVAAGRVLAAMGAAAFQANAYAMAGLLAAPGRRGRALAAVTAGMTISMVIGVPFGVLIGQQWGWRGAIWVIAALAAVTAAVVPALPSAYTPPTSLRTRIAVLARPPVLALLVSTVVVLVPGFLVLSYLPAVLDSAAATGTLLVVALAVLGLGQVVGNRIVGRLVDARGALPVLLLGAGGATASFTALGLTRSMLVAGLVVLFVSGVFGGLVITPQQHRHFALAPDVATVALGLNGSAIYLGAALGAGFGGSLLAVAGPAVLPWGAAAFGAVAVTLIWLLAPERWGRSARQVVAAPRAPAVAEAARRQG